MVESRAAPAGERDPFQLLSAGHQRSVGILALVGLVGVGVFWSWPYRRGGTMVNIEHPIHAELPAFAVDINQAPWYELAVLPGIGGTMARRIVAFREANGRFRSKGDVTKVHGIGPRTLALLEPYIDVPPPPSERHDE